MKGMGYLKNSNPIILLSKWFILVCGAVFVLSSVLKALEVDAFAVQVSYYGLIKQAELVRVVALGVIGVEAAIGLALLFGLWLRRVTIPLAVGILLGFTGLLFYAWLHLDLGDCGCFGTYIPMSAPVSILKNVLLIVVFGCAWFGLGKYEARKDEILLRLRENHKAYLVAVLAMGLVILSGLLNSRTAPSSGVKESSVEVHPLDIKERPFAEFKFEYEGLKIDLGTGTYVVAMLSDTCEHCGESIEPLNEMLDIPGFPFIVGLCLGEEETFGEFIASRQPKFPVRLIEPLKFFEHIGDAPPRFILVRDGKSIHYWDDELPEAPEILDAMVNSLAQ